MEETVYVYPKVKVREQEDQEDFKGPPLNDDSSFPAKENEEISPAYVAKIPKSYVPNVPMSTTSVSESLIMPTISASEGAGEIDKKIDEDDKINIRACSILRPRAVLSSPETYEEYFTGTSQSLCSDELRLWEESLAREREKKKKKKKRS
ncbi:uncharacterized protein LOC142623947 isoform X2 [Castanea sativa]|uniref:uncharacterized protein LOC142623947 isoform X2 n=1 Tax=Castanea sativa TaxID=21020 RepID=UPI003F64BAD1